MESEDEEEEEETAEATKISLKRSQHNQEKHQLRSPTLSLRQKNV